MNRVIVYPGALPQDTDLLNTNRNAMIGLGYLAAAALGDGILVDGLALTPASPPSMVVTVGPGSIYALEQVDAMSYGSLGTDTTQNVVKQGVTLNGTPFTLTAPGTSGTTQLYLIEAQFEEVDGGSTVLPYYNSTNPAQPYSGPGNTGAPNNTVRTSIVGLQLVSTGVAYPTGSDPSATSGAVPPVDEGWVGLYLIPVNNGQTAITAENLVGTLYPGAPFPPQKISTARQRLSAPVTAPVSATGSDSWVQPTPFTPFATLQHAVNYFSNGLDFNGQPGTITLGAGTFAGAEILGTFLGQQAALTISGAGSANTTLTGINANALELQGGAQVLLDGISISATGSTVFQGIGIVADGGSNANIGSDVKFLACSRMHMQVNAGGSINGILGYSISGGAEIHLDAEVNGSIGLTGTITAVGTPNFSTAFANADSGIIRTTGLVISGAMTGPAWSVTENGVLSTGNGGTTLTGAGLSSGSTASGGQVT